jgi:hypothetical protein
VAQAACFYFKNEEKSKKLTATFFFTLSNLAICDAPAGSADFKITLAPGKDCVRMLKPQQEGEETSIQMRYEFQFE